LTITTVTPVQRWSAAILTGLSGALVMYAMLGHLGKDAEIVVFAFAGAFLAGIWTARYFGQPGGDGVLEATVGAMFATVLGVILASLFVGISMGEGLGGILFSLILLPPVVAIWLVGSGTGLLVWLFAFAITHTIMRLLRKYGV
jgi:hypothetical protein